MNHSPHLVAAAAALFLCVGASAQTIQISGTVVEDQGVVSLELVENLQLVSGAVDVLTLVDLDQEMTGTIVPGSNPVQVAIDTTGDPLSWTRIQGDTTVGGTFDVRIDDDTALRYYTFVAFNQDFLPLDPLAVGVHGTLYLNFANLFVLSVGPMIDGRWRESYTIPNDPTFAGLNLWFQSGMQYPSGELVYGNLALLSIELP